MPDINFQDLFNTLSAGVVNLAETSAANYVTQAKTDGICVLNDLKNNIEAWAIQLKNKQITHEELEFTLGSQEALLKMVALKQAGIAAIELDKFKAGLIDLISKTLSSVI